MGIPRLQYLQQAQYESWCRKADDPEWMDHRYRDAKDRAMMAAIRELRDAFKRIEELERQVAGPQER